MVTRPQFAPEDRTAALWVGGLLVVAGIFCLFAPAFTGIAVAYLVGAAMIASGLALAWAALRGPRRLLARGAYALLGLALAVFGVIVVLDPVASLTSLTALIGIALLVSGAIKLGAAVVTPGKRLVLTIAGGVSVLLAILILAEWPLSSEWAVGVLVGLELLTLGVLILAEVWPDRQMSVVV
jgi:uncharacterized membrane protein HdeD (DUF308 family)